MLDKSYFDEYAKVAIYYGVNVQEGQMLVINAPVIAYELVEKCVKEAYKKGASKVVVNYNDEIITRTAYEYETTESLSEVPNWSQDKQQWYIDNKACFLHIIADDPDLLSGIDDDKVKTVRIALMKARQKFRYYTMNNIGQWSILAYPNVTWAKKVFPNLDEEKAVESLWQAIIKATRIEKGKTLENWDKHNKTIRDHAALLNSYNFKSLHFKTGEGTDLTVGLIKNHIWEGGCEKTAGGIIFNPNMPTEEVFTMPDRYHIDGKVISTKPLSYGGKLINKFELTFKDGKVIEHHAQNNEDTLTQLLDSDEGSRSLGEVALISYDSPISDMNIIFYETLFDENASCHLALGACYPTNLKGGADLSEDELYEKGGNKSMNHVDFMFGARDMEVVGLTEDGKEIKVFDKGNFAI